jgi:hypothetical protein
LKHPEGCPAPPLEAALWLRRGFKPGIAPVGRVTFWVKVTRERKKGERNSRKMRCHFLGFETKVKKTYPDGQPGQFSTVAEIQNGALTCRRKKRWLASGKKTDRHSR